MAAPEGNEFWKARSKHGRDKLFKTPDILWESCAEYFQWCEQNPLQEAEVVKYQGDAKIIQVPKMRAMTISGLCIFLDISQQTWFEYAKNEDYTEVSTRVDAIIRTQKFQGAAADLLNASIIARDLGLVDKRELSGEVVGRSLSPEDQKKSLIKLLLQMGDILLDDEVRVVMGDMGWYHD